MELNEKLQELRRQKGLTQEELARALYVSRTAVSKWESGRGYPSIDSLKAIAKFFSLSVDELLSTKEVLILAEADQKETKRHFCDLICNLADLAMVLLLFLPLFSQETGEGVMAVSLLPLSGVSPYLKLAYFLAVGGSAFWGAFMLVLRGIGKNSDAVWGRCVSVLLGMAAVLLLIFGRVPYAASFAFVLLACKALALIKYR